MIFGRRIEEESLKRATSILFVNLSLALTGVLLICGAQPEFPLTDVLLEAISAIGTVGLISSGITRDMGVLAQVVLNFLAAGSEALRSQLRFLKSAGAPWRYGLVCQRFG